MVNNRKYIYILLYINYTILANYKWYLQQIDI